MALHSLFEYSLEAIVDFSDVPLRIATVVWPSLVSIILLVGSIQLFCLGIIGKIYSEMKDKTFYVIEKRREGDRIRVLN